MPKQKKQHLKRRPDGRFVCRYKDQFFYGLTEDEALSARDAYKRQEAQKKDRPLTVSEYAMKWLPLYKSGVSDKCYNDYAKQLNVMLAMIGGKTFDRVTVDDARSVYQHYAGYSQSTIKRSRMLFIALFDAAVENGIAARNPFRSKFAQPDKGTAGTHRVITPEERDLILTTPHRMRPGALVMLYAGLRRGEALAIDIDRDIDFQRRVIRVRQAVRYNGNRQIISSPKTAAGTRDVPLFPILAEALADAHGILIPSASGEPSTQTAFVRAWQSYMIALTAAAGHPVSIRCHDLRHTFCTMLRDSGIDMKLAMQWMGHADEKMILRVYDHVTDLRVSENLKLASKTAFRSQNGSQTQLVPRETQ